MHKEIRVNAVNNLRSRKTDLRELVVFDDFQIDFVLL